MTVPRAFTVAAALSAAFCAAMAVAWVASEYHAVDAQKQYLKLAPRCHVSVDYNGRLLVFSDPRVPHVGSATWSVSGFGQPPPVWPKYSVIGSDWAIMYFSVHFADGSSVWTLTAHLLYPLMLSAVLPTLWVLRSRHHRGTGFPVDRVTTAAESSSQDPPAL